MATFLDKKHIRDSLRRQRQTLSPQKRISFAKKITQSIAALPAFQKGQQIGCYLAAEGEVSTEFIIQVAKQTNKQVYLPAIDINHPRQLVFYHYQFNDPLIKNRFGIHEPDTKNQKLISPDKLDLVFLPLVAFDISGNRIGRGAGYYDRTFAFLLNVHRRKTILIGLAYAFQKIPIIQPDAWDIPLNMVVTEKQIYSSQIL